MKKLALALIALGLMSGCRTIAYSDKVGNKLNITSFAWDSSIGNLNASNGTDTISLTNYASKPDQQALQLMDDMVKAGLVAPAAAPAPTAAKPQVSK